MQLCNSDGGEVGRDVLGTCGGRDVRFQGGSIQSTL